MARPNLSGKGSGWSPAVPALRRPAPAQAPTEQPGEVNPFLYGMPGYVAPPWGPPLAPLPYVTYVNGASVTPPGAATLRGVAPSGNAVRFYDLPNEQEDPRRAARQAAQSTMRSDTLSDDDAEVILAWLREKILTNRGRSGT